MTELIEKIGKIVPVVRLEEVDKALPLAQALLAGGINCMEVTFRAFGAEKVIKAIRTAFPQMIIGAGTVLTLEQARAALEAGAHFIVAPGFNKKIAEFLKDYDVLYMPGVVTPSEIEAVMELGLRYVKFFPAEASGGIDYIKAISAPYSEMYFMPTGGITIDNINNYLAHPRVFACGGSFMVSESLIKNNQFEEITRLSKQVIMRIKQ